MFIYSLMYFENGKRVTKKFTGETRMDCINKMLAFVKSIGQTMHDVITFDDTNKQHQVDPHKAVILQQT